ncbi:hypothetical protein PENSPDRAFT_652873 [Peniophora sp. CONT]|nr:hypothetical protein PENSPDRAFT_652873 [Peniophora sp. CONT]
MNNWLSRAVITLHSSILELYVSICLGYAHTLTAHRFLPAAPLMTLLRMTSASSIQLPVCSRLPSIQRWSTTP